MKSIIESSISNVRLMDSQNISKLISDYIPNKYLFIFDQELWARDESSYLRNLVIAENEEEAYSLLNKNDLVSFSFDLYKENVIKHNLPLNCESKVLFSSVYDDRGYVELFTIKRWNQGKLKKATSNLFYNKKSLTTESILENINEKMIYIKPIIDTQINFEKFDINN
jgi:hypothetical protein